MGTVVSLDAYRSKKENKDDTLRSEVLFHIYKAVEATHELGENGGKLAWLLEDCAAHLLELEEESKVVHP